MGYEAALSEYDEAAFSHGGRTRKVFKRGSGPAVIVRWSISNQLS